MGFAPSGRVRLEQGWPRERECVDPTEFPFLFPKQGGNNRGRDISVPWMWGKVPLGRSVLSSCLPFRATHSEEKRCSCRDGSW